VGALGRSWERRFGRYPGDWVFASLLLLLVAAGSATAGIVAAGDTDTATGVGTIVATSPVVTAPPTPPVVPTTTNAAPAPAPTPRRKPPAKPTGPIAWPNRNGFTVVLASIPARGTGRKDADAKAKLALSRGLRKVGILVSGKFSSLHPGYLVVFSGVYDTLDDAQTAATRAHGRFPNAYARQIAR
jgi:hypothetical protein